MATLKPPTRVNDLLGPALVGWGALAAALALGGADGRHYWMVLGAFGVAAIAAFAAWRLGRRQLAGLMILVPPLLAAAAIVVFMVRMIAGFFG